MAKAVLIMDMPESCANCQLSDDDPSGSYCMPADDYYDGSDSSEDKASFCPLRELPEKMEVCGKYPQPGKPVPSYRLGWNSCLDEILEERKE